MSDPERDAGACRVCGRSCLEHRSHACRSCRRGKPESWVARQAAIDRVPPPILSDGERSLDRPRGWRERSAELWRRQNPAR